MSENTYFRFIGLSHKDREQVISDKYSLDVYQHANGILATNIDK